MVHGFPEGWYSWRHQIGAVAQAGYTVCAIDVRGYGGSDKPYPVEAYAMEHMVADCVAVAKEMSPDAPATLLGHDWGAAIVWFAALSNPDIFRAVASLSVPFLGVPKRPYPEIFREQFTAKGRFFYQDYFQAEGVAEAEAEADPRDFLLKTLYSISGDAPSGLWMDKPAGARFLDGLSAPETLPIWLTAADLDQYEAEFKESGFRGPLNRYRNYERDFEWLRPYAGKKIEQPCLFIGGTRDPVSSAFGMIEDPVSAVRKHAPLVEGHMLEGCGHWTQQERPAQVNALVLDWLKRL